MLTKTKRLQNYIIFQMRSPNECVSYVDPNRGSRLDSNSKIGTMVRKEIFTCEKLANLMVSTKPNWNTSCGSGLDSLNNPVGHISILIGFWFGMGF